jgi:hypothetical protein
MESWPYCSLYILPGYSCQCEITRGIVQVPVAGQKTGLEEMKTQAILAEPSLPTSGHLDSEESLNTSQD